MDKSEVITISSDEEGDYKNQIQVLKNVVPSNTDLNKSFNNKTKKEDIVEIIDDCPQSEKDNNKPTVPEIVDLVESCEKSPEQKSPIVGSNKKKYFNKEVENSKSGQPNSDSTTSGIVLSKDKGVCNTVVDHESLDPELGCKNLINYPSTRLGNEEQQESSKLCNTDIKTSENFFDKFVMLCATFEDIECDRAKLVEKLYKRYQDANPDYVQSDSFKNFIEKCEKKICKTNVYLLAYEVVDNLRVRKKIEVSKGVSNLNEQSCDGNEKEIEEEKLTLKEKKKNKIINKIIKYLDVLGLKIHELENTEVDLSDEEESTYIQLQRYRQKYCSIYKKLCEYTNEVSDANRIYSRKICFSGSKYTNINKCIESWLNKTKRFPDFLDILKLLESQSASLGLPPNREGIRSIALEIFQQVGVMLQQRRKYDLWDSFCGYLDETEDPANNNPELEKILKENYETRMKKEQEIISYFSERQEKERLKPDEVHDTDANISPEESDDGDEKEIEEIENSINKKLDRAIQLNHLLGEQSEISEITSGRTCDSETKEEDRIDEQFSKHKETKNNYKNCKSLKWREAKNKKIPFKNASESTTCSNDSKQVNKSEVIFDGIANIKNESTKTGKNESRVSGNYSENKRNLPRKSPFIQLKRITPEKPKNDNDFISKNEHSPAKRMKYELPADRDNFSKNCNGKFYKEAKSSDLSFDVHYFQIEYNFQYIRKFGPGNNPLVKRENHVRGRVFRDLTNISKLLRPTRSKMYSKDFRSPTFYHRGLESIVEPLWNKRFRINDRFREFKYRKCAFGHEEMTGKEMENSEKESKSTKDNNSSGSEKNEESSSSSGHGNGNEGDNNENDENEKNGKSNDNDEEDENKDEEDVKNEGENDDETNEQNNELTKMNVVDISESPTDISFATETETSYLPTPEEIKPEAVSRQRRRNRANPKKTRQKRSGRRFNLITAEATVGEEVVVEAEVTLEENIPIEKMPHSAWSNRAVNVHSIGSSSLFFNNVEVFNRMKRRRLASSQTPEPSDEERVKQFLLHSPSSISITPPKTLSLGKPPSQEVLKALATLRRLKGISTTRVRKMPHADDDITVIDESGRGRSKSNSREVVPHAKSTANGSGERSGDLLPLITKVQSIKSPGPKILEVEGNFSGFEQIPVHGKSTAKKRKSSSANKLKISNIWGGPVVDNSGNSIPSCSYPQCANKNSKKTQKKKTSKKSVEYVELE